jgi:hypothetical protein
VARVDALHALANEGRTFAGAVSNFVVDWGKVQFEYSYDTGQGRAFGAFTGELRGEALTVIGDWVERNSMTPAGKANLHLGRIGNRLILSGTRSLGGNTIEQWTIDVPAQRD